MSRVFIRYALPRDADRLVADGVVGGPTPTGEPWLARVQKWLAEQKAGRRLVLVRPGPLVSRAFNLAGFEDAWEVVDSPEEALRSG